MKPDGLRWAVVGSGAVGLFYGGRLAAAGNDVSFLVRSDLATVREKGIAVRSPEGDLDLRVQSASSAMEIGPVDIVLIALKTTSNPALLKLIPPLLHERTLLVTMQNGLGNEAFLARHFGAHRVVGTLCFVCLNRVAPGVVEHYGHGRIATGAWLPEVGPSARQITTVFSSAGVKAEFTEDLMLARWRKLVWNVPFNGLSIAAGGITVDQILADPLLEIETRELMREVIDGAAALGKSIPLEFIDSQIHDTVKMGAYKPSSLIDYFHRKPVEVDAIWGEPLRQARQAGVELRRLGLLHALLQKLTSNLNYA